jgi:phosphoserine phosphatase
MKKDDAIRRSGQLEKVLEITRAMAATQDLDALLQLVIDRAMELLDAERATVFLYDADTDELVSRVAAGTGEIRISAGTGLAGAVARGGKLVNVTDAYSDDRFNPDVDRQTGFRTRNILSLPMWDYHGALVGVLQVLNKREGPFADEDIALAEVLAAQAGVAIQRANLIRHFLLKQQMERAMEIAQEIQRGLLPTDDPQIAGFDVAGLTIPADHTGGDTYDFMPLPDGRWMFVVADATGHGIGPALIIAETRAMLRAICLQRARLGSTRPDGEGSGDDVPSVLETTNELLMSDLDSSRFVTCFLGLLDPDGASLVYASAGHGPLLFYDAARDDFDVVGATSIPLGVMDGAPYGETVTRSMSPGDFAAIVTDGFIEATNPEGEQFGTDRLCRMLRARRGDPPATMIRYLHAAVLNFAAGQPQADDLTAVIIRRA